ncbi:recombination limiting protein [Haemophilus influenzae]|uniref:Recombination limiting protein n=1 Tax=Haemophilus influenzae TaxID=727 RepID=A0A2X1PMV1_HAEIF|nr:recombination limiting protein [Haemophilus influenzae]
MPILRTVANLWRIERGNAEAKEIAEKAGEIYNQICLVAERLKQTRQYAFHCQQPIQQHRHRTCWPTRVSRQSRTI